MKTDLNKILIPLILIALLTTVNASCSMHILKGVERDIGGKPLDVAVFDINEEIIIGTELTKQIGSERVVVDVLLQDPDGFQISNNYLQANETTNYVETYFTPNNNYVNGSYTITTTMTEFDANSTQTCIYTTSKTFQLNSPRSSSNSIPLNVSSGLNMNLTVTETCKSEIVKGVTMEYCVSGYMPVNTSFEIEEIDFQNFENANFTTIIEAKEPTYSYEFLRALVTAWEESTGLNVEKQQIINELNGQKDLKDEQIQLFASEIERFNDNRIESIEEKNYELTEENTTLKNQTIWNYLFGFLVAIGMAAVGVFYLKREATSPPVLSQ